MLKKYTLQGLDCANCAAKIENAVRKIEGVKSASVDFLTTTLSIDVSDDSKIKNILEKVVHKYEPEIIIMDKEQTEIVKSQNNIAKKGEFKQLAVLATGLIMLVASILIDEVFNLNEYIVILAYIATYIVVGGKIVLRAFVNISKGQIFDENFLMGIATVGAFAIGEQAEAVAVMLFYLIGEYFQDFSVNKSKKSISELMDIRPDYANLLKEGEISRVSPENVNVGDVILIKPGERIPLDGIVISGNSSLDTKALTGEALPRDVSVSSEVLSGCVNLSGALTVEVKKTFGESTAAKIIDLVENASSRKAVAENFITTFAKYYTPVVVGLATLVAIIPPIFLGAEWFEWIRRGLIFLVVSCPCALVVSIPLSFFSGIGRASKSGILVKGGNYLEALNHLDTVVFDKTGTLTKGVFEMTATYPANGFTTDELLEYAANAEAFSTHPIAVSIRNAYKGDIKDSNITDYREFAGHGVSAFVSGKKALAGSYALLESNNIKFDEIRDIGTKIYISLDSVYVGCIVISDQIKEDSYKAISALKNNGIKKTVMLTGDNKSTAESVANTLKIDEFYYGLLPNQKVEKVEYLKNEISDGKLAFVGDGINDAPVLAIADVGIAMGGLGSDAAIEAADIVLMTDEPYKLAEAVKIAGITRRIVWQNIVFSLALKVVVMILGAFGMASMWGAVFADVGVSLLAVLNSMRTLKTKL